LANRLIDAHSYLHLSCGTLTLVYHQRSFFNYQITKLPNYQIVFGYQWSGVAAAKPLNVCLA
jgi:hypothetical protein